MAATYRNLIIKLLKSNSEQQTANILATKHKIDIKKAKDLINRYKTKAIATVHKDEIHNLIIISDTHCGCKLAVCPREGTRLDDGGRYMPSEFQLKLLERWDYFWNEFVPEATRGEPFAVLHNGDAIDGVHHNSVTQISNNLTDQKRIAYELLKPIVDKCEGRYYHIRGTEAHVGKSAQEEEDLAASLGAVPNSQGQHARYDIRYLLADKLIHALHHIGSTGSQAYEATAVHKELTESYLEACRWGQQPPDIIVRSHRHRNIEITMPTMKNGSDGETSSARAVVTPCWQGKTPFAWKIPGARLSTPQFGGILIRYSHPELFIRSKVWTVEPSEIVRG